MIEELPMGLRLFKRDVHGDKRGIFQRLFSPDDFPVFGNFDVRQVNHTRTAYRGSARGLHAQAGNSAETKIVTCLSGAVFDVAVDIRFGSPTYSHWHAVELRADTGDSFVIPPGFAHGFQVLEAESELLYVHDRPYDPANEIRVSLSDPYIGVLWPLPLGELSLLDAAAPNLQVADEGFQ